MKPVQSIRSPSLYPSELRALNELENSIPQSEGTVRVAEIDGERREAYFSDDEIYRYRLHIHWSAGPTLTTIGLNPSTADHLKDDPTIRKCKKYAIANGFGSYQMLNLFGIRSTDYKAIFRSKDPVGPKNTVEFLKHWCEGTQVIACWGCHTTERNWKHYYRGHDITEAIPNLLGFKITPSGHPQHPLYLPEPLNPGRFSYSSPEASSCA